MRFEYDPPLPSSPPDSFWQVIRLIDDGALIASARWVAPAATPGTAQVVELHVTPKFRRSGHARRLFREMLDQASKFHAARKLPFRRVWAGVGHKTQVVGRSFLTGEGFHHVGSGGNLLGDEDLLIYAKSFR